MKVIYPVLFFEEKEGGYSVFVPDLENKGTCGNTIEESMEMAEDLIAGIIVDKMEADEKIPSASKIEKVSYQEIEKYLEIENWDYVSRFKSYIVVDTAVIAQKWGKELVKKTVNIPKWINAKAEKLKINFSKTLEEALMEKIYK